MVISKTPFRLSFLGGGTDLPSFYCEEDGAVLSGTINKYMHICVNDRFDRSHRLAYDKTEIRVDIPEVEHPIFRTVLGRYAARAAERNGGRGLELLSVSDIPSGTGLGSSSSFTVGLLNGLLTHLGQKPTPEELAEEASQIEIEELSEPIGKQDQYAAAFGGLQLLRFHPSGAVTREPVSCSARTMKEFQATMMLFYTGMTRPASSVLSERRTNTNNKRETLREMKGMAEQLKTILEKRQGLEKFGRLLDEGWEMKKTLASGITLPQIDNWYARAKEAGAWGGKILGAGGGGFLLFMGPPDVRDRVQAELKELQMVPFALESGGSRVVFNG